MQKLSKKLNIGLVLVMILMIVPGFFAFPHRVAKPKEKEKVVVSKVDKTVKSNLWTVLPQRAVAFENLTVYSDVNLTKKVGEISAKTQLNLTALSNKAFKLSNGDYISADKDLVISDIPLSRINSQFTVYSSKSVNVFYNPFTTYDTQVLTVLTGNQILSADKIAQTHWGTYYEIALSNAQKGWVSSKDVSLENPKLQQVQNLLNQKYKDKKYSIYVKELNSKFTVGVNQNEKMYSASLSKIPILYWVQKRLNEGQISLNDPLLYSSAVNGWYGSYQPAGTGNLPKIADNKVYSLQDIINRTAKLSDNVGSNMLSYYETQKFSADYQKTINKIAGSSWNPATREASAEMVGNVLEALYNEGGACFDALFNTTFDNTKIRAGIPQNIPVAHKIGDADNDNHDAAVVFAPTPYILVIETAGASDEQIQQISQDIYGVLK